MGAQTSNEQIPQTVRVESEYYSAAKSISKSRRIFPPNNKQNKSKDIYPISLQFSQINSIEQQPSRPSESFMGMFTSRHHQSISHQKINLSNFSTLGLPAYNYKSEHFNIDEGDIEYKIDYIYKGMKYNGSIKDFKPHGKGILESEYEYYEGYFKNGVKHIHGRQYLGNQVYEGEYFQGRRKGMGVLYTKLKVYKGQFHQVFVKGIIEYKDGSVYEGEVDEKENKIKKGKFTWAKGMSYSGEFQNNNFNGLGVYVDIDGNTYEGHFLNGLKNGQGIHNYVKLDQKYQGSYLNNKKHGKGKYWSSVSKNYYYQGQFKQDRPHGKGILRNQFGERKVGHENGILKSLQQS